jgi:hypothetical protein
MGLNERWWAETCWKICLVVRVRENGLRNSQMRELARGSCAAVDFVVGERGPESVAKRRDFLSGGGRPLVLPARCSGVEYGCPSGEQ